MKIVIVNKEIFHNRPPVISTLLILSDLGHKLKLITVSINDYWRTELEKRGVELVVIEDSKYRDYKLMRMLEYINFQHEVSKILSKEDKDALIWVIGGNTILSLGSSLAGYRYVLQVQELDDDDKAYMNCMKKLAGNAKIIVLNEYNRSILYQCWFKLKKRPIVLPNKPYFLPTQKDLDSFKSKYKDHVKTFLDKKVILYQGIIHKERDLSPFIKALSKLDSSFQLVLLGKDRGCVDKYKKIDPNIIHIQSLPAPDYLVFTSICYMGIVAYDPMQLNTAYCAPNKIYEYAAYGKPMIGNDIPGLHPIINNQAGVLIDISNEEAIIKAIHDIDKNYATYSKGANALFVNTDNKKTLIEAIKSI